VFNVDCIRRHDSERIEEVDMRKFLVVLSIIFSVCAVEARAEFPAFMSGKNLYEVCQTSHYQFTCIGYIIGVADTLGGLRQTVCLRKFTSRDQVVAIGKIYLADHPEYRHFTASSMIRNALEAEFPCN
jgi:hypothetical protein